MPNHRHSAATRTHTGRASAGRRLNGKKHLKWMGGALETTNATFELYNNVFGEESPLEKLKGKPSPEPDGGKSSDGAAVAKDAGSEHAHHDYGGKLRSALQAQGLALGPWEQPAPPALGHGRDLHSQAGVMETVVNALKTAYAPHRVNVVTWDAALDPEDVECGGQTERGTAYNIALGVSFKFVVFSGHGRVKWQGGSVGCAGNVHLGSDHISFGDARYGKP